MPDAHLYPASTLPQGRASVRSTPLDRWILARIQQRVAAARLRFVLWDGFEVAGRGALVGTIRFHNRAALLGWGWDPDLYFGEAYMFGAVEIDGDLLTVLDEVYRALGAVRPQAPRRWRANTIPTARANVHHHYDLGNDFYRLWLDRQLVYTCAYFPTPACTLEEAQDAKMDLVCRKIGLKPGDRVVEAGCGWGALALFMARQYGATVRAFNVSAEQIAYARERAKREGLDGRVEFIADDYRNVTGRCDAFVSVGMLEHVGLPDYGTFGDVVERTLDRGGRGFLHFIGRNVPAPLNPWIVKRIFPGAYPPTLREVFERILEPHAFSVLDVHNLRLHYAATLDHWRRRFEDAAPDVARMFDEVFVRAWRLYLAGSQVAFATGSLQLFQIVFARADDHSLPRVRDAG
jgi:cyclopropane-fatty-acyl-phospholipid synthase